MGDASRRRDLDRTGLRGRYLPRTPLACEPTASWHRQLTLLGAAAACCLLPSINRIVRLSGRRVEHAVGGAWHTVIGTDTGENYLMGCILPAGERKRPSESRPLVASLSWDYITMRTVRQLSYVCCCGIPSIQRINQYSNVAVGMHCFAHHRGIGVDGLAVRPFVFAFGAPLIGGPARA